MLLVTGSSGDFPLTPRTAPTSHSTGSPISWVPEKSSDSADSSSNLTIIPSPSYAPETCANGTPDNPYPHSYLPYGYLGADLWGLPSEAAGSDALCYTGGLSGSIENDVNFSDVPDPGNVLAFPNFEYGQDLSGGTPGTMTPGFTLPETDSVATNQSLWLTNTYYLNDPSGKAEYDYMWDNWLTTYPASPSNTTLGNYTIETMLWMSTGYEVSPWTYLPAPLTVELPTLVNSTLSDQPWEFSYFCQGSYDQLLTVLYYYNGTGGIGVSARTVGVDYSAVLVSINAEIHADHVACWSDPQDKDTDMYLDNVQLGTEVLTPPTASEYYGLAQFNWTVSSICFRFPTGTPTAADVSCSTASSHPLSDDLIASTESGRAPLAVTFDASPSGGTPPYDYAWTFGDGTGSSAASPEHTFDTPGNYTVRVTVTDFNGTAVTNQSTVRVSPSGSLTSTAKAYPANGSAPLTVLFVASVAGGDPPYQYSWKLQVTFIGNTSSVSYTFQEPGQYTVVAWANDSTEPTPESSAMAVNVTVGAPPPGGAGAPPSGSGPFLGISSDQWGGVGLLIAAFSVGGFLLIRARRDAATHRPVRNSDTADASSRT